MPIGHHGFIAIVPEGIIPVINFSHELVVALKMASNHHLPMLLVTAATTLLHKLSHAVHSFIFGNKSPPCLPLDGEPPESGWILEEKSYKPSSVFMSNLMTLQTIHITFEVSTLPVQTRWTSDMCLVSKLIFVSSFNECSALLDEQDCHS